CDRSLWERASLIERLGDVFEAEGSQATVKASLNEPLAALLTLIRACEVKAAQIAWIGGPVVAVTLPERPDHPGQGPNQ
ncbi:MAG: hypothetical protein JWL70_1387, partial [Acidimicrobiia bacterium]|nr:hypothetical protein [Acidimicrobiia bacterium]